MLCQAALGIRAGGFSSIAIEAKAVAVCFSAPSITQNTSAATTATWRPGLITRARQIRRRPDAGDNRFSYIPP